MEEMKSMKVSKIVAQNYETARVFSANGIDFCCNGGIPLEEACRNKNVDIDALIEQLERALTKPSEFDFRALRLEDLINHIIGVHHGYVESTVPVLQAYLKKLCEVHGERHPELHQIKALFDDGALALFSHMQKEEQILFPFIWKMCQEPNGSQITNPAFGHIENPIAMMKEEHSVEGERFKQIGMLTNNYEAPADGCQTYRVSFAMLGEFEEDLHKHIHLENNILFPKAMELYQRLTNESIGVN